MKLRKDRFMASLLVLGLAGGVAGCSDEEETTEAEAAPEATTGSETMEEPDMTTGGGDLDGGMEEPMDEPAEPMGEPAAGPIGPTGE